MKYPKPYFRTQRKLWYVQIGKKQISLGADKAEAWREYHRVMSAAGYEPPRADLKVAVATDLFLGHAAKTTAPATFQQYSIKLLDFADTLGRVDLTKLTATQVTDWVKAHDWSTSTRRGAITAVKVMLGWCVKKGMLATSPVKDMKRPRMGRRERTVTPEERAAIRAEFTDGFGDFLDAMTWTGARPGEVMRLEAAHLRLDEAYAAMPGKTTEATSLLIEFPLTPPMLELCRRLAGEHPEGPIFRNAKGKPWTANAVRCRMRRLRARLGGIDGVTAYTYRHSFATDALERGVPVTDVAALMNHRDIRTTMNYAHLTGRRAHLARQAAKATGGG